VVAMDDAIPCTRPVTFISIYNKTSVYQLQLFQPQFPPLYGHRAPLRRPYSGFDNVVNRNLFICHMDLLL
jgi:hypothetical protein